MEIASPPRYRGQMAAHVKPVGDLLREWRQRRGSSQLTFACEADVSAKHLSFVETGRSVPSREMILHLAGQLEIPLRERNVLLVAAGYAVAFQERPLSDPALQAAQRAVSLVLAGHEPYPAMAVDRHWTILAANRTFPLLVAGVHPRFLQPPVNALRVGLHPEGLAPRIANFAEWRVHVLSRLQHQINVTGDPVLTELKKEIAAYELPGDAETVAAPEGEFASVVVPLRLVTDIGTLNLVSTTTLFGTPLDITLEGIAIESFFPADDHAAAALQRLARMT